MYVIDGNKCLKCGRCSKGCHMNPGCDGHTCFIQCGNAASGCPVDAIVEAETQYIITENCNNCGTCATRCPVGAISLSA